MRAASLLFCRACGPLLRHSLDLPALRGLGASPCRTFGVLLCLVVALWGLPASTADAHATYVFGRIDAGKLCVHGYFTKDRPVMGGELEVRDASGLVLLTGRTDSEGRWCAETPAGEGDLQIILNAGQGHRAEFVVPRPAVGVPSDSAAGGTPSAVVATAAQEEPQEPGLKDIFGGLGWIVALCALGYIFLNRKGGKCSGR